MIAEKPSWIRHEGMQIFSILIQPAGLRFATGGEKTWFWDGSGEPPDVENWKVAITLRGHSADVHWILSNWDVYFIPSLKGHSSLVKGVAWDPIGYFLASQSDDKTVVIWRTSDWSLAHKTEGHWAKSLGSTFFRRLAWSPCGHFITTTHGYQKPRHSAPVLDRGKWAARFDFLGHNALVIAVKFNHSMFRRSSTNSQEGKATPEPDGYSLFPCSLDGMVATFHFEVKELCHKLSDAELDELKRSRYGDDRGRQENLAESPSPLLLEAASAKESTSKKVDLEVQQNQIPVKSSLALQVPNKSSEPQNNDRKKSGLSASDRLNKMVTPAQVRIFVSAQSQALDFPVASSDPRKNGFTARVTVSGSLIIEKVSTGQDRRINVKLPGSMNSAFRFHGKVSVLAGNANFWAVGCEDGCLQVYTKCGRCSLPTMMLVGSAATFIDCDESWKLSLITRKRSLYLWDLFNRNCLLHDSLESLITMDHNTSTKGTIKVISAKLSKSGFPLVVLFLKFGLTQTGEPAALQVNVRKYLASKQAWSSWATDDGVQTRAHLEAQLASSLALKSPNEYRQSLLSYIRFLIHPSPPTTSQPDIDLMDSNPSVPSQTDTSVPATDNKENPSPGIDQMDTVPSISVQANSGIESTDPISEYAAGS
ncbi:hypothetical protein F3Y22_tig00116954pilonHSYRG00237 [Hibiscus syriacus]|uniref:Protein HIRA-like C-terminal domain-containing protein n=1 Tax=Hibiscus syriacus TaxID=106335 RepID=A0A6A2WLE3_HIBSY|nr:hypothetical protein F3Y22_tig00116954pilonHSYRG00237 [Hibiscus syriacus]